MKLSNWLRSVGPRRVPGQGLRASAAEVLEERVLLTAYLVDTLDDVVAADGKLSLREAIQAANTNAAVFEAAAGDVVGLSDVIRFDTSLAGGTIVLTGTRLDITDSLAITGLGSTQLTISGNNAVQIFAIAAGARLNVFGVTLTKGFAASGLETRDGGAIFNEGTLVTTDVVIGDSTAAFRGAAIYNEGSVWMIRGAILRSSGTEAVENSDGDFKASGTTFAQNTDGVFSNWATLSIENSTFEANEGTSGTAIYNFGSGANTTVVRSAFVGNVGGAIVNQGETFRIADSTFTGNTASSAGAIKNFSGVMDISGSTLFGNFATTFHGGAIENSGTLRISNSTISGNEAGWYGGAIYAWAGSATLRNVTITGNRANVDGTGFENGAGIYQSGSASVVLYNTIVIGNRRGSGAGVEEDIYGSVSGTSRNNVIGTLGFAGGLTNGTNGNIVGVDWTTVIDPVLRDNGGPTMTHALPPDSIAIDAGDDGEALDPNGNLLIADQRGFDRFAWYVDIGAFEVQLAVAFDDVFTIADDAILTGNVLVNDRAAGDTNGVITEADYDERNVGELVVLESGALLQLNADGSFTYDPNGQFHLFIGETATDYFNYTMWNGGPHWGWEATVTITIQGTNVAPTAEDDFTDVVADETVSGQLLDNDADPNGDALSVVAVNGQADLVGWWLELTVLPPGASSPMFAGYVLIEADGSFTFDPNGDFGWLQAGETTAQTIEYTIGDGRGGTATALLDITIEGTNLPPVAVEDEFRVRESGTVSGDLLLNDSDPNGDVLLLDSGHPDGLPVGSRQTLDSGARVILHEDGTFTYDPNGAFNWLAPGETAVDWFTYGVTDGRGIIAAANVRVVVYGAGRADLVANYRGEWWVGASNGSRFDTTRWAAWRDTTWTTLAHGDFNADGRSDVLGLYHGEWWTGLSTGTAYTTSAWGRWANIDWQNVTVADLDGDGKDDILARAGGGWWAALSTGTAFAAPKLWSVWASAPWQNVSLVDLNADGRADLLGRLGGGWWAGLSNGNGFAAPKLWAAWADIQWDALGTFDPDGDGRADLYGLSNGTWWVGRSNGSGFATERRIAWAPAAWKNAVAGDFDGDGRDDLMARLGGGWWVNLSSADGRAGVTALWAGWANVAWQDVRTADLDGDGRDDLLARLGGGWWAGTSNGSTFNTSLWATWANVDWRAVAVAETAATPSSGGGTTGGLVHSVFFRSVTLSSTSLSGNLAPIGNLNFVLDLTSASSNSSVTAATFTDDDDPLALFWSTADEDEEFAGELLAV